MPVATKNERGGRITSKPDASVRRCNLQPCQPTTEIYDDHQPVSQVPIAETTGAMNKELERAKTFNEETKKLVQIVERWKTENKDLIDFDRTKILDSALVSSSGKVRLQFFVVPQQGRQEHLEKKLTALDQMIHTDRTFTLVSLVSFFI